MKKRAHQFASGQICIWCPACDTAHGMDSRWQFNGNFELPTFLPSILALGAQRCHSYVTDGVISYLADSTHGAAGKSEALPEWPEAYS